jgi:hypothetical protein
MSAHFRAGLTVVLTERSSTQSGKPHERFLKRQKYD